MSASRGTPRTSYGFSSLHYTIHAISFGVNERGIQENELHKPGFYRVERLHKSGQVALNNFSTLLPQDRQIPIVCTEFSNTGPVLLSGLNFLDRNNA
jgi:hypothetical protein